MVNLTEVLPKHFLRHLLEPSLAGYESRTLARLAWHSRAKRCHSCPYNQATGYITPCPACGPWAKQGQKHNNHGGSSPGQERQACGLCCKPIQQPLHLMCHSNWPSIVRPLGPEWLKEVKAMPPYGGINLPRDSPKYRDVQNLRFQHRCRELLEVKNGKV